MRFVRVLLLAGVLLSSTGCKVEIYVPPNGRVETESGVYSCDAGNTCIIEVTDLFFDETFVAVPDSKYAFAWWRKRPRGLCGGLNSSCRLQPSLLDGNEDIAEIIESEETFYLEPVFDRANKWTRKADMPMPRLGLATSLVRNRIYAIGGYTQAGASGIDAVEAYDPVLNEWIVRAPLPTPRRWLAAVSLDGHVYAIGGDSGVGMGVVYATVEVYDPKGNSWSSVPDMPTPRYALRATVLKDKIYAVGGTQGGGSALGTVEVYDPKSNSWRSRRAMPTPRTLMVVEAVNEKLYAIGGGPSPADAVSTVEIYDPSSNSWNTGRSMPTARSSACSAVIDDKIYVSGGGSGGRYEGPIHATVEVYDPETDSWSSVPDLPTARWALACSSFKERLFVIGGAGDWESHPGLPDVESYVPRGL